MQTTTNIKCPMCYKSHLVFRTGFYPTDQPGGLSYEEWYECGKCGYNPDKDKEIDNENGKGRE